jgi:hypothetical protein
MEMPSEERLERRGPKLAEIELAKLIAPAGSVYKQSNCQFSLYTMGALTREKSGKELTGKPPALWRDAISLWSEAVLMLLSWLKMSDGTPEGSVTPGGSVGC